MQNISYIQNLQTFNAIYCWDEESKAIYILKAESFKDPSSLRRGGETAVI